MRDLFDNYALSPLPFADELLYRYDFGDYRCAKITLLGIEERATERAQCVAADGMKIIDKCGGMAGYYDFLKAACRRGPEGKKEARRLAGETGRTGRKRKPEDILQQAPRQPQCGKGGRGAGCMPARTARPDDDKKRSALRFGEKQGRGGNFIAAPLLFTYP